MGDFWTLAEKYGLPIAMLLFGIFALYTDMIVSGKRFREVSRQRDRLLKLALGGQRKAFAATDLAEALVEPQKREDDPDADA